ncbi:MAG: ABC transporter permease subunit [Eubacterium sp.]|nr:ABC transporter permease subunit [Eubacterium sp.]
MIILRYELKKILTSKLTVAVIIVLYALDVFLLLTGTLSLKPADPFTHVTGIHGTTEDTYIEIQKQTSQYAGEITQEWYEGLLAEYDAYINDPANRLSDEELFSLANHWREYGWSEEEIEDMLNSTYYTVREPEFPINAALRNAQSIVYAPQDIDGSLLEFEGWQDLVKMHGEGISSYYKERYPGVVGETLSDKAKEMYDGLAENFTPYYNYDYGWWQMQGMHRAFPITVGLALAVALGSLFTADRARGTEGIVFATRHGRRKLIYAKIGAGFIFTFLLWLVLEITNAALILIIYGPTGWEAVWSLIGGVSAPFMFNQSQITLVTIVTSLFGTFMAAGMVMLVSALAKSQYASLIINAALLIVPMLNTVKIYIFGAESFMETVMDFFPGRIMGAINEWESLDLLYVFGNAVPTEYLIIPVAVIFGAAITAASFFIYRRRQPAN